MCKGPVAEEHMANIREGNKESVAVVWTVTSVLVRDGGDSLGLSRAFHFCCNDTRKPLESFKSKGV